MSGFLCSMVGASFVTAVAEVIRAKKGITAVGNAQVDTAQSKFGGASALFDGNGDLLQADTSAALTIASSADFTIEGWIRPGSVSSTPGLFTDRASSNSLTGVNWDISIFNGTYITSRTNCLLFETGSGAGSIVIISNNNVFATNTWYHFAVVRSSNVITLYVNGVDVTNNRAGTQSSAIGAGNLTMGGFPNGALMYTGHMDEIRWSNTARYTTTFTPSTTAFVNDANTVLLIHCDGTDASTFFEDDNGVRASNGITAVGNAQVDTAQSKFGGSALLCDGTGDYVISPAGTQWDFGTGSFTIEYWIRFNVAPTLYVPIALRSGAGIGNGEWWCEITNAEKKMYWGFKNQAGTQYYVNLALAGTAFATGQFYHIALVNNAGTAQMYVNGTATGTTTALSGSFGNSTTDLWVGAGAGAYSLNGWLDEVRISNTARYTTGFTPSTTPFVNDSNTLLLIHADGTDASTVFTDDNGVRSKKSVISISGAEIDTAQSKFGGSSLLMPNDGNKYLTVKHSGDFLTGTGAFCVEGWFRPLSAVDPGDGVGSRFFYFKGVNTSGGIGLGISTDGIRFRGPGTDDLAYTGSVSNTTFSHIAFVWDGTNKSIYLNGSRVSTTTAHVINLTDTTDIQIGYNSTRFGFNGHIDELRHSKVARYSGASLTQPTTPFQNDANTLLLIHADGTDGSTVFTDDNGVPPDHSY